MTLNQQLETESKLPLTEKKAGWSYIYHLHIQTEPNFADGLVHKPLQQKMVSGLDCCLSILCKKTNTHNS